MRGGGGQGACGRGTTPCAQASQWGVWVSPAKGLGAVECLRGGGTGVGGIGRAAAGSDGHTQESMRNTHSRAISASWEKRRVDTIAKTPPVDGERGIVHDCA